MIKKKTHVRCSSQKNVPLVTLRRRKVLQLAGAGVLGMALSSVGAPTASAAPAGAGQRFWAEAGMDVMAAIYTRRSQRDFTGAAMPRTDIDAVIAAGMNAPSAHNLQPWRFVILTGPESLRRIYEIDPYREYALRAGAAVLVCVQAIEGEPMELNLLSAACCVQNMLLACHAMGYGGVWVQVYPGEQPMQAWREQVELPSDCLPLCLVVMGKTSGKLPPVNRMDASKIHVRKWRKKQ